MNTSAKFSLDSFVRLSSSPGEREELLAELEKVVLEDVAAVVSRRLNEIAEELRVLGHGLVRQDDERVDHSCLELSLLDPGQNRSPEDHRLHIHLDLIASAAWNYEQKSDLNEMQRA
jgi:hypothetical protein